MSSGDGTAGGTMRIGSARMLLKWAAAGKPRITANPTRTAAASHEARGYRRGLRIAQAV
jgi:hypothetical protein